MIRIEFKLLQSRKLLLPASVLLFAIVLLAFVSYWTGAEQKQLEGTVLASFIAIRATQSSIIALFFLFWMMQFTIHLQNSGYYKMLLLFGWQRKKLFLYSIFQIAIYALLFMLINFVGFAILSVFYGTNPLQLVFNTNINALLSQFFYLFLTGVFAVTLGTLKSNYVMVLPIFIYWILEGWLKSILKRKFELEIGNYFPLQASKQIISENLLNYTQMMFVGIYVFLFLGLLHYSLQRKMYLT